MCLFAPNRPLQAQQFLGISRENRPNYFEISTKRVQTCQTRMPEVARNCFCVWYSEFGTFTVILWANWVAKLKEMVPVYLKSAQETRAKSKTLFWNLGRVRRNFDEKFRFQILQTLTFTILPACNHHICPETQVIRSQSGSFQFFAPHFRFARVFCSAENTPPPVEKRSAERNYDVHSKNRIVRREWSKNYDKTSAELWERPNSKSEEIGRFQKIVSEKPVSEPRAPDFGFEQRFAFSKECSPKSVWHVVIDEENLLSTLPVTVIGGVPKLARVYYCDRKCGQ